MKILIAGATGLIGQELIKGLSNEHQFTALGRSKAKLEHSFAKSIETISWEELDKVDAGQFDAVINLCGVSIAASRWTPQVKEEIISSRVQTTKILVQWILRQNAKPHLYCANAIGIYGLQENGSETELTEDSVIDFNNYKDFLNEIGIRWQQALLEAENAGLAVTTTRFGVVLKEGQGFLGKLQMSYKLGLGSVIGKGDQYLSWIDSEDLVKGYRFLLEHSELVGAINFTAPNPCTQKAFAKAFAHSLNRPLLLTTPAFVIRLLLGEMGECLINRGQKVIPKRLIDAGFTFQYPTIEQALQK